MTTRTATPTIASQHAAAARREANLAGERANIYPDNKGISDLAHAARQAADIAEAAATLLAKFTPYQQSLIAQYAAAAATRAANTPIETANRQ